MGVLNAHESDRRVTLGASTLVGRSSACTLKLESSEVSSRHAALFHTERGWVVRDMGSRNGTYAGGQRIDPGARATLEAGTELRFADEVWVLEDAGPPVATARSASGERLRAVDGLLALPDAVDPVITIFPTRTGRWIAERDGDPQFVADGDTVTVGGVEWALELPPATPGGGTMTTVEAGDQPWSIETVRRLTVAVSLDEETIGLTLHFHREALEVPMRAHHVLIRVLAQARLDDAGEAPAEQGWLYTDDVCRAAGVEPERLYVDVYRARKQLAALGVQSAADLFERRSHTRQIRLGIGHVEITELR